MSGKENISNFSCPLSSDHLDHDYDDNDDEADLADEHRCADDEEKDRPKLGISASDLSLSTKANLETIIQHHHHHHLHSSSLRTGHGSMHVLVLSFKAGDKL